MPGTTTFTAYHPYPAPESISLSTTQSVTASQIRTMHEWDQAFSLWLDSRRSGHLIGSAAGVNVGYYLITTPQEFQEFLICEYLAKIKDMGETVSAMKHTAEQQWGARSLQLDMFEGML